ncbi:dihydrodipicolinate synthase family protein [Rhizobium sp. FY34]|uniref:dihydrodipicolinate synthase family protein n=1 Tax=Rhizobium sp. FY34 TaxID=2562309 RepID=UPI0010BF8B82|nr:dihydrodipicolinate synthase family protein [Rhizobium sp. FY34]
MFRGLSAFPSTPTDDSGIVDTDAVARLAERLAAAKVDSIGLLGSTGGYAYLSRSERRRAVEAAAESVAGRIPLIVGIGALRTDEVMALARDAKAGGADALLLAPMSYTPLTQDEVFAHFEAVAAVTDLPIVIYNNPGTTKFTFGLDLIVRLATLPTVATIKMPPPIDASLEAEIASLRARLPNGFPIGYSGDWVAAEALLAGADAFYSVVAGLLPQQALAMTRAAQAGDAAKARQINESFEPLWALFKDYGSFRVMFAIADRLGLFKAAPPRPVLPIPSAAMPRLEEALQGLSAI